MLAKALWGLILLALGHVLTLRVVRRQWVKSRAGAQFDFTLGACQPAQLAGLQPDPHTAGPSLARNSFLFLLSRATRAKNEKI